MKEQTVKSTRRKSVAVEISYVALAVALITVCAWISVPISAIPVTLQTFAVCFIGALLGWKRGCAAIFVYVLMGLIGIPVFAGFKAGAAALFGPTGGYIFGFFFLAVIPALFKQISVKNKWGRTAIFYSASIVGATIMYFFGTVWFVLMYQCTVGYAISLCVLPYILPDLVKLFIAAFLAVRLEKSIR